MRSVLVIVPLTLAVLVGCGLQVPTPTPAAGFAVPPPATRPPAGGASTAAPATPVPSTQPTAPAAGPITQPIASTAAPPPPQAQAVSPPTALQPSTTPVPTKPAPAPSPTQVTPPTPPGPPTVAAAAATAPATIAQPDVPPKLEVTQVMHYSDGFGGLRIQGLIENKGPTDAAGIEIAVSLVGDGNATVGAARAVYKPVILLAGRRSGWLAVFDAQPAFKDVQTQVQSHAVDSLDAEFSYRELAVEGATAAAAAGTTDRPRITGRVRNTGAKTADSVRLLVTTFAPDGSVDYVDQVSPALTLIPPGQTAPFDVTVAGKAKLREVAKYDLLVEGMPKR